MKPTDNQGTEKRQSVSWQTWAIIFLALILPTLVTVLGTAYLEYISQDAVSVLQDRR